MGRSSLQLLVIFLFFSHFFSSDAIPLTRTRDLFQRTQIFSASSDINQEATVGEEYMDARIDLESSDYEETNANDRHTPKPPGRT
ncbi:hypothetical protein QJS10_CPB21g00611 [Acorus calamus]|uniref:Uncharacterized protein n=1 Tax=Acorus calamus TaxID=4465 RepID=A0AAV9C5C1_ACOCL|nr:hypothetical protein QJS10_CPB21g00611 [Acorus calamus]